MTTSSELKYGCGCKIIAEVWLKCDLHAAAPGLLKTLKEAQSAIKSLDEAALGTGGTDRYQWYLRDELLNHIDYDIAKAEGKE